MAAFLGLRLIAQVLCSDASNCDDPAVSDVVVVDVVEDVTPTPAPAVDYAPGLPVGGALGQRLYCIEGHESTHGLHMLNPVSGARGWLQWLPATARAWGVSIGDRASEWSAAARIAERGETVFRSQWPVTSRLCP